MNIGEQMYKLADQLFPICRSITGNGVRETLQILKTVCPYLVIKEVASGTKVFDWTIPDEWNIEEAYIENSKGEHIVDIKNSNLHVVSYSAPLDIMCNLKELQYYLYSNPEQPEVIPYVTSYYKRRSGFCISDKEREMLPEDTYHLKINSKLEPGHLTYGEILIPGESQEEIFISTYVCHPSMANNELSGPCVAIYLANWLLSLKQRRYSYRIVFVPETIGSITYLSENLSVMKNRVIAGFNLTCIGDTRTYSYVESRYGDTLADKITKNVMSTITNNKYEKYSYLERGSDERQYCSPGVDLPLCTICRSKYHTYPEYHTSKDDMKMISGEGLGQSYNMLKTILYGLENNKKYLATNCCEPQLGKRNLYNDIGNKKAYGGSKVLLDVLAYADGNNDVIDFQ